LPIILACSPDGAKRNPGNSIRGSPFPDFAALHPGYEVSPDKNFRLTKVAYFGAILPRAWGWTVFIQRVNF
jgi:hypothetical protein